MTITIQHRPAELLHPRDSRPAGRRPTGRTEVEADDRPAEALTSSELAALPGVLDVLTAARVLGIGRTKAYELVRTDQWPTPVLRVGRLVKIPTAPLLTLLGITGSEPPRRP
jgi:hypothetical protein